MTSWTGSRLILPCWISAVATLRGRWRICRREVWVSTSARGARPRSGDRTRSALDTGRYRTITRGHRPVRRADCISRRLPPASRPTPSGVPGVRSGTPTGWMAPGHTVRRPVRDGSSRMDGRPNVLLVTGACPDPRGTSSGRICRHRNRYGHRSTRIDYGVRVRSPWGSVNVAATRAISRRPGSGLLSVDH